MCCFTRPVTSVNTTRIFARVEKGDHQFIVYSMHVEAAEPLAMVLPLPVKPGTDEKRVTFINLKDYPRFFDDMETGFPVVRDKSENTRSAGAIPASAAVRTIEVVQVGDFEASFVPTEQDFSRLDARFQLPAGAWKKLPAYKDYGFAVFKLKQGLQSVQPMAFSFPRRDTRTLFFPTVHIHDGKVHAEADFDHVLYCQPREGEPLKFDPNHQWEESRSSAGNFMKLKKVRGLLAANEHCYKTQMNGNLPNRDTFVALDM